MNSNITCSGMEESIINKSEKKNNALQLHVELKRKDLQCSEYGCLTSKIYDYRRFRLKVLLHPLYKGTTLRVSQ